MEQLKMILVLKVLQFYRRENKKCRKLNLQFVYSNENISTAIIMIIALDAAKRSLSINQHLVVLGIYSIHLYSNYIAMLSILNHFNLALNTHILKHTIKAVLTDKVKLQSGFCSPRFLVFSHNPLGGGQKPVKQ